MVKHTIDTGENQPFKQQLRSHPMAYLPVIDKHAEKMAANESLNRPSVRGIPM